MRRNPGPCSSSLRHSILSSFLFTATCDLMMGHVLLFDFFFFLCAWPKASFQGDEIFSPRYLEVSSPLENVLDSAV